MISRFREYRVEAYPGMSKLAEDSSTHSPLERIDILARGESQLENRRACHACRRLIACQPVGFSQSDC